METWEYFSDRVKTFLTYLPDRTLNAGIDAVTTIIVYDMAAPYTAKDYQHALAAWLQGRHDVWQDRIDEYKSNPTDENLANIAGHAINQRVHNPLRPSKDGIIDIPANNGRVLHPSTSCNDLELTPRLPSRKQGDGTI